MDAAFEPIADAVMEPVLGPAAAATWRRSLPKDRPPYAEGVNGSAFGSGWYGYVDKDLRRAARPARPRAVQPALLRRAARSSAAARRCGRRWPGATAELAAAQGPDPSAWRSDATLERITFSPGLLPDTMRWTNRPTFQQVLELDAPGG